MLISQSQRIKRKMGMTLTIEQGDDGKISIDGKPVKDANEAVQMIGEAIGADAPAGSDQPAEGTPEEDAVESPDEESAEDVDGSGAALDALGASGGSPDDSATLEDKKAQFAKKKQKSGMRPGVKPNWSDYGV